MASWTELLPSGKHQARYTLPDGRKRSAGTFTTKRLAAKAAATKEAEAAALGWRDPRAAEKTWGEWCETWWSTRPVAPGTLARDESPLAKHLMPKWGDVPLIEITRHDVKAWAKELSDTGLAPTSVQRHVHLFSASLTAAIDKEIITVNPASRLRLPHGETDEMRFLSREEAAQLLSVMEEPDQAFTSLLLGSGGRWGEGAGASSKRLDRTRHQFRIAEVWDDKTSSIKAYPKGRKIRNVPLPDWVIEQLPARDGLLFGEMNYANWRNRHWLPALRRADIGHVRVHDLRHTYASWQIQAGTSLYELGRLLGHVSPTTTQRYAHLLKVDHTNITSAVPDPRVG